MHKVDAISETLTECLTNMDENLQHMEQRLANIDQKAAVQEELDHLLSHELDLFHKMPRVNTATMTQLPSPCPQNAQLCVALLQLVIPLLSVLSR
jgi:hypothetical protein